MKPSTTWKRRSHRKVKYSATELSHRRPAEKKSEETLKQPIEIEFVETPLKDVVDYLNDLHHIEFRASVQISSASPKKCPELNASPGHAQIARDSAPS